MIREIIYKDRDNTIDLQLSSDSGVADLSSVTKIELIDQTGGMGTIGSDTFSSAFDWSSGGGVLVLSLGGVETVTNGVSNMVVGTTHTFDLIVYDTDNINGVNWGSIKTIIR